MSSLPDAVARRWTQAKAAFELSCRSGNRSDVDAILNELAELIRALGRKELESLQHVHDAPFRATATPGEPASFATTPRPASTPAPHATTLDHVPVPDKAATTVPPGTPGASTGAFVVDAPPASVNPQAETATHDAVATTDQPPRTDEETITYVGQRGGEKAKRRIPVVEGYTIVEKLGHGGMGVVYKATDNRLKRTVALKMILAGEHASQAHLTRFEAEARAVAQLKHPNIVQIYAIGEHEGLPFFSLEFCPGGSLDRKLNHEPCPPREAAGIVEQLARAMEAAHAARVLHRDIKPSNILLDENGIPKVSDFGLAREIGEGDGNTRTGSILGTPSYMPPEQALGKTKEIGPASDQYSIGATLYAMITGRPPFQGASTAQTLEQVCKKEPVPPTQLQPGCPKDLETICLKALSKEPHKRYASCAALADDLRAFLDGRPIAARPVGSAEKLWRWSKRNPRVAGLVSLVSLLILIIGAGGTAAAIVFDQKKRDVEKALRDTDAARIAEKKARDDETIAHDKEKLATKDAEDRYILARESLIGVVTDIPIALDQAMFAQRAEQQVLEALAVMLQKLMNSPATRGLPDRAMSAYHLRMGDLYLRQQKVGEAEKEYSKARDINTRLLQQGGQEKEHARGNLALALRKLGDAAVARRNGPDALKLFIEVEKLQREIIAHPEPGDVPAETKQSLANTLLQLADVNRRLSKPNLKAALEQCEESLKLFQEVISLPATLYTANARLSLATAYIQLGKIHEKSGQDDQAAEKALIRGADMYQELLKADSGNLRLQVLAAEAYRDLGDFLLKRNKLDAATKYHEWDLQLSRSLVLTPEIIRAQARLSDVYYRSATLLLKKGDRAKAGQLYRECLELRLAVARARPTDPFNPIRVSNAQARCGLGVPAIKTMEEQVAKYQPGPKVPNETAAYITLQAACVYAMTADVMTGGRPGDELAFFEGMTRRLYTDRALTLLEDLVGRLKYTDVVSLKTDPDLDAIRPHPRFQALIRKLETPTKP